MLRGRERIYKTNGELLRENSSHGRRVIKLKVDVAIQPATRGYFLLLWEEERRESHQRPIVERDANGVTLGCQNPHKTS